MRERFNEFTLLVSNIHRCIYKIKTEEVLEFNLKSSHVSCLYYIYRENSLTAKELCDICGEDKANISRAIKYLKTNGFLVCDCSIHKRYKSKLLLTEKGQIVAQRITKKVEEILSYASVGLSENNRNIMYRSLNLINDNLNQLCNDYHTEK